MSEPPTNPRRNGRLASILYGGVYALFCVAIVAGAWLFTRWLVETKPQPVRRERPESVALVEIHHLSPIDHPVEIHATGTVTPAREVAVTPRVAGEVVRVAPAFVPGGRFAQGETLLHIERTDYELALAMRQAEAVQSRYQQTLELGHQAVARSEWERLPDNDDLSELEQALILRKPHLEAVEARVKIAEVALEKAALDLARTTLEAPFNLLVREKHVSPGAQVSPQTVLATVIDADEYWIEVDVPVAQLAWLRLPEGDVPGSAAQVVLRLPEGGEYTWRGHLQMRRPDLDPHGRLARLIVGVRDPYGTDNPVPLLIGAFVHVYLQGPVLREVYAIPRAAFHDGGSVWLRNADKRLEIVPVERVHGNADTVFVREGLPPGGELVVSGLAAPVPGMLLATPEEQTTVEAKAGGRN